MVSWVSIPELGTDKPCPRCWHSSVIVNSNILIVLGGYVTENGSMFVNDMFQYHIDSGVWEQINAKGDIPTPRHSHTLVQIRDRLLLFGGEGFTCLDDLYEFDLENKEWHQIYADGQQPMARCSHSAVTWRNNMVIFGGECYPNKFNDLYLFNLNYEKWQQISAPKCPPARNGHSSECIKNELWVFGGWGYGQCFNDVYKLNLAMPSSWQEVKITSPVRPSPRGRHASVELPNNHILIFGGQHNFENNEFWLLNTEQRSWHQIQVTGSKLRDHNSIPNSNTNNDNTNWNSPQPKSGHTMCIGANCVYVFGGITGHFSGSSNLLALNIIDLLSSYNYDIETFFNESIPSKGTVLTKQKPLSGFSCSC
eukprot:gb/GECH01006067.1/.p1 GENE.gb/GECH01006067.1/~~gb/GECH01006067.1/.p1  ORF type:complete len:366 (+),score=53.88 gb/GECH01006067.1/:1-1098(+)